MDETMKPKTPCARVSTSPRPARESLRRENEDLRTRQAELQARLEEAEETLAAIRSGAVDALVISGSQGDQIFSLQGAETTYRVLVEEMNESALLLAQDGTVLYANARLGHLLDIPIEKIIGAPWERLFTPAERPRLGPLLRAAATAPIREETYLQRGSATASPDRIAVNISLRSLQRENLHGFSLVITDLTAQKAAEAALRKANGTLERRVAERTRELGDREQRLRMAKAAAQLGIHEYRPLTGELIWDDRMYELWGLEPDAPVTYEVFMARLHPEDRASTQAAVDCALDPSGNGQYYAEYRLVHPNRTLWVAATGDVSFENGRAVRLVGTVQDITARKEFQAELERLVAERTAELQELVTELEHFSYTITHDMRAPLRAMQAFAEMFSEACIECQQQDARRFLQRIRTSTLRMDALIRDALSYNEAIRKHLPLAPVDAGLLLRGMLDTYPELQGSDRRIQVQPDIPRVFANEAGLTQVFSNLLNNAIKFAKPGQPAEIRVWAELTHPPPEPLTNPLAAPKPIHPTGFTPIPSQPNPGIGRPAQWVRIWVEDHGVGIPTTMLPRVFNMFARGTNEQSGTGIGLALVRKVVDRMGGRVGVESQEGQGSRFWLELIPAN